MVSLVSSLSSISSLNKRNFVNSSKAPRKTRLQSLIAIRHRMVEDVRVRVPESVTFYYLNTYRP